MEGSERPGSDCEVIALSHKQRLQTLTDHFCVLTLQCSPPQVRYSTRPHAFSLM